MRGWLLLAFSLPLLGAAAAPLDVVPCKDASDSLACADRVEPLILGTEAGARREGATLVLPLEGGGTLAFSDGEPAPGADVAEPDVRYRLFARETAAGLWIVLGRWQDGEQWYVVDRRARTVSAFAGVPHLSLDGTRLAESNSWTSPWGQGLRVWRLAYPEPILEFSLSVSEDPLTLEPAFSSLRWTSPSVLSFQWLVPVEGCEPSCYRTAPGQLVRARGRAWQLDGIPEGWPSSVQLTIESEPARERATR